MLPMLNKIKQILNATNCKVRFAWFYDPGIEVTAWVNNFTFPEKGYIEIPLTGPIKAEQLKWLEIDPIETQVISRLIAPKKISQLKTLTDFLAKENIIFSFDGELIKIEL
ncbi:hypothetical protein EV197_1714 [Aquimarina brevivitae]|uniref:Uncharacterized protein n=2 Tax=Aquimarina brevivitae TaxID=323412 RepID=A0A4Q7P0G2_9FLAO|nr:hypothetical protein EV197_1714 [Aquimarina brevivitae]